MNLLVYFLLPLFISLAAILFLKKFSEKTGFLVDKPEGDALKIHKKSIPLIGGIAMATAFLISLFIFVQHLVSCKYFAISAGVLIIFFLGLWDDVKWKHISTTKPLLKFALLLVCTLVPAVILSLCGIAFHFVPYTIVSVALGFVYIFACINAVNYQDGMDGLGGGLVLISLLGFMILGVIVGNTFALSLSLISLGAAASFLIFNLPPAKIFMGDSGAYLLGFILAVIAILFSEPYNIYSVFGPIFVIGLPLFDGVYTNIRRLVKGKSIFHGDRSHFYDKLLQKGFSTKKTLAICCGLQVVFIVIGMIITIF